LKSQLILNFLSPKLKFIINKQKWTGHIRGKAMREIPEEDFNLILREEKDYENPVGPDLCFHTRFRLFSVN